MKRMTLIAAALCLMMIATVGAGVVAAKQTENPSQAGDSPVYFFDLLATGTHGKGKLMINTMEHKFVFTGRGFDPDKTYFLQYYAGYASIRTFASAVATPSGNLHVEGTWTEDAALPAAPSFDVRIVSNVLQEGITLIADGTDNHGYYYRLSFPFSTPFGDKTHAYGLPAGLKGSTVTAENSIVTSLSYCKVGVDLTMPNGQVAQYTMTFYADSV